MRFDFHLIDWTALGFDNFQPEDWHAWCQNPISVPSKAYKCQYISSMDSRRLSIGAKFAIESAVHLMRKHPDLSIDAIIFSSQHGEVEKQFNVVRNVSQGEPPSPSDFTMSVHNSAIGYLSILETYTLPTSSIVAGIDSFQQALLDAYAQLATGSQTVLCIDYETKIPEYFHTHLPPGNNVHPYAVGLLLTKGNTLQCEFLPGSADPTPTNLPQSLQFLQQFLLRNQQFTVPGLLGHWNWIHHV